MSTGKTELSERTSDLDAVVPRPELEVDPSIEAVAEAGFGADNQ